MARVTRSRRKRCPIDWCTVHYGNRKLGPHAVGRLIPESGPSDALVLRVLHDDGRREARMAVYDPKTQTWTYGLPLPARPRKAYTAAVANARRFVREGVLVP
jgi:hypothetical protein